MTILKASNKDEITAIVELGRRIWTEHYTPIIGLDQVNYMLDKFQSFEAITKQIQEEEFEYYQINSEEQLIGYIAVQQREDALFLSKIYIQKDQRGKGIGKEAMDFIFNRASELHCKLIRLTVNKYNSDTIKAYEKIGFQNMGPAVFDIGNGYIMDDYIMEYSI